MYAIKSMGYVHTLCNSQFLTVLMAVYGCAHGFHGSHDFGFPSLLFFFMTTTNDMK
jgi:hypothetical protein